MASLLRLLIRTLERRKWWARLFDSLVRGLGALKKKKIIERREALRTLTLARASLHAGKFTAARLDRKIGRPGAASCL